MRARRIRRFWKRSAGLAATCDVCGHRGGPAHVPWVVVYWPEGPEGSATPYGFRCDRHRPGNAKGDVMELEK